MYFWNSHKDQHSSPQVQRERHLRYTLLGSGTWDPLLQCLYLDKFLLNRKNTNCKRLKITVYMHSWGKLWKTRHKKARNPAATSEVSRAKSRVLCMVPAHSTTKGGEQRNLFLVFAPSCCSTSASKTLPEFLIWPLYQLLWITQSRNLSVTQPHVTSHTHPDACSHIPNPWLVT